MYMNFIIEAMGYIKPQGDKKPNLSLENIVETGEFPKAEAYYNNHYSNLMTKVYDGLLPENNTIPTEEEIKKIIDYINNDKLKKYNESKERALARGKAFNEEKPTKLKFYTLTKEEKEKREALRKIAAPVVSEFLAKHKLAERVVDDFLEQNNIENVPRALYKLMDVDVKDPDEIVHETCSLFGDDWKTREDIIRRKVEKALDLLEEFNKPSTDEEILEKYKDKLPELSLFGELDANKMEELFDSLNMKYPDDLKERINRVAPIVSTVVLLTNKIVAMANPCYPLINEQNGPTIINEFAEYYDEITTLIGKEYDSYFKSPKRDPETGAQIQANAINGMAASQNFECYNDDVKQSFEIDLLMSEFFKSNVKGLVDSDGIVYNEQEFRNARIATDRNATDEIKEKYKDDLEKVNKLAAKYNSGKRVAIIDNNNKYAYSLHIESEKTIFPPKEELFNINLDHPVDTYNNIMNALKAVDPWHVKSHQEFKDLRKALENLDNKNFSNVKLVEALPKIRDLASKYIESKKDVTDKNTRTVEREEFCKKLVNTIEEFAISTSAERSFEFEMNRVSEPITDDELGNDLENSFVIEKTRGLEYIDEKELEAVENNEPEM